MIECIVVITAPETKKEKIIEERLRAIPEVKEISGVYGESDYVVKVEAHSMKRLGEVVYKEIHDINGVFCTREFIVYGESWERN